MLLSNDPMGEESIWKMSYLVVIKKEQDCDKIANIIYYLKYYN